MSISTLFQADNGSTDVQGNNTPPSAVGEHDSTASQVREDEAVKGILICSSSNIRIFDVKSRICQTVHLHRFAQIKSVIHRQIFEYLKPRM